MDKVKFGIHWDIRPVKQCFHPDWTYGEICVKCNDCKRFNKRKNKRSVPNEQ